MCSLNHKCQGSNKNRILSFLKRYCFHTKNDITSHNHLQVIHYRHHIVILAEDLNGHFHKRIDNSNHNQIQGCFHHDRNLNHPKQRCHHMFENSVKIKMQVGETLVKVFSFSFRIYIM